MVGCNGEGGVEYTKEKGQWIDLCKSNGIQSSSEEIGLSYEGRHVHYDWREQGKEWIWIIEKTKLLMSCVVSSAILVTQYYVSCFWGSDWGSDRGYVPAQTVLGLAQLFA